VITVRASGIGESRCADVLHGLGERKDDVASVNEKRTRSASKAVLEADRALDLCNRFVH